MIRTPVFFLLLLVAVSLIAANTDSHEDEDTPSNSPPITGPKIGKLMKKLLPKLRKRLSKTTVAFLNQILPFLADPNKHKKKLEEKLQLLKKSKAVKKSMTEIVSLVKKLLTPVISKFFKKKGVKAPPYYENRAAAAPDVLFKIIKVFLECERPTVYRKCTTSDRRSKYRTPNGICNNLKNPLWGASKTTQRRVLPSAYSNNFNSPRKGPSARAISKILVNGKIKDDKILTDMVKTFAQFVDHDISETPHNSGTVCKKCKPSDTCFPIPVPKNDTRIKKAKCLNFGRSHPVCSTGLSSIFFLHLVQLEQLNEITAYVDASNVYGSSAERLKKLRSTDKKSGRLEMFYTNSKVEFLPFDVTFPDHNLVAPSVPNFLAGDNRANENLQLLSMHTLWARYHNKVAERLKAINPHWKGEKLFQETKKIVTAIMQHIVYGEYLDAVLGKNALPAYKKYKPKVDPSIFLAFSSAAYRMGHTMIRDIIARRKENFKPIPQGDIPLFKSFFTPEKLFSGGGIEPILRGLYFSPAKLVDPSNKVFDEVIRESLFNQTEHPAPDLLALNIQRGRDHGIPSYNDYRVHCGLKRASTFAQLKEIKAKARLRLKKVYQKADQVDLFVGGVLEEKVPGAEIGPTFHCLIKDQFRRLRDGDRFYYEKPDQFTKDQLKEIKKMSLAKVICEATAPHIVRIPPKVFKITAVKDFYRCCFLVNINLHKWKEAPPRKTKTG